MSDERKKLWEPSDEWIDNANVTKFIKYVNDKFNANIEGAHDLYKWSVDEIEDFWAAFWDFSDIKASKSYDKVVEDINVFPGTNWFPGARLNFAENLLKYNDDQLAFIFQGESKITKKMSYAELNDNVARLAKALRDMGVEKGDRVVSYIPNLIETPIAMLATTSIGAIWASCGAELQASAVIDRFAQIEPKALFTVDGYFYKDSVFETIPNAKKVVDAIPSIEKVIVASYVSDDKPDISSIPKAIHWDDFISKEGNLKPHYEQLPFDHPIYIMFSSGTTGKPKCMVQSGGGVLINHLKELILSTDLKRNDVINYITAPSWMMWNWLISSLGVGATIFLYDGNPLYPEPLRMFELIEKYNVSIFGVSATYIHYLMGQGLKPKEKYDLSSLREISQTASALSPEGFQWCYNQINEDLYFNSISGGTDINGCFAGALPILPVYSGELQGPALAMKIEAYDENGEPIRDEQAELVCEAPAPSMPIYFWGDDEDMSKYKSAYFEFYDDLGINVWRHGDWIVYHSDTGGITFWGRSDATLKPSGVRIGTSEIYNVVEQLAEVSDSLAIGHKDEQGNVEVVLFVELVGSAKLDENLKNKIKSTLRERASPRHVPSIIKEVPEEGIPYTFSGKKVEIAVTKILHGMDVSNRGALRNPKSLDFYNDIKDEL
ncbi:MAG: acetoacetate--CoA ligase [Candidatus Lokiarchaeota archaeon]|nr:acetoacetate--CoA ligase [Candidatus Lokiarchaeota archaeon]MBD3201140.1 acetoacetate--CoA ligase [Candidatus Lokiarchaeota archaeon]